MRREPENGNIVSIDIDTGAAFGNRFTLLGLSSSQINGDKWNSGLTLQVRQLDVKAGYYRRCPFTFDRIVIP